MDDSILITVREAARLLAIGTTLAHKMVSDGRLPYIRLGRTVRIPRASLYAMIESRTRYASTNHDQDPTHDGPQAAPTARIRRPHTTTRRPLACDEERSRGWDGPANADPRIRVLRVRR